MLYIISKLYTYILRPILFLFKADDVHELFLFIGKKCGEYKSVRFLFKKILLYKNKSLRQQILEINFQNPIGLAAGFDYNADLIKILPSIGFGFQTIGTITNLPYEGNVKPRLARLPESKSLLVNKGFKNEGIESILNKIPKEKYGILGISIGYTNKHYDSFDTLVSDVADSFIRAEQNQIFDYFELNISCPNLININKLNFQADTKEGLSLILEALSKQNITRPIFIKIPSEKSVEQIDEILQTASKFEIINGVILSNLIKNRENPLLNKEELIGLGMGNFSGKPTFELSNNLIKYVYRNYKNRFVIIGCGGVFTAEDAYKKIKLGASLIQLITGMVYLGPQQISKINRELVDLIKSDGFENIRDAIGFENH